MSKRGTLRSVFWGGTIRSGTADEAQIETAGPPGERLDFVAGFKSVVGTLAPIPWPPRRPGKTRMADEVFQGPGHVVLVVAGKAHFSPVLHQPRQIAQGLGSDEPAPAMSFLGPGVGK